MKKTLLLALSCLAVSASLAMAQGGNYGGQTYLSWSRDATVRNIAQGCNDQFLFIKLANVHEVKGVEFGLYWTPNESAGQFVLGGVNFPTSPSGVCTYLMRGTVITVTVQPDNGSSFAIAAAGSSYETACTFGNVANVDWDFSVAPGGCSGQPATFALTYCKCSDHSGVQNQMAIIGGATIGGATAAQPTTWGVIKHMYN